MTASTLSPAPRCWVVTDGTIGMEIQCIGLAEAVGSAPEVKRIHMPPPWRWLPPGPLLHCNPLARLDPRGDRLTPPWPELLISCGRQSVAPAAAVRRAAGEACLAIHIQDPKVPLACFDLIAAPRHDLLSGPNVIETTGGLNRVTAARLAEAGARVAPRLSHLPERRVAVMIGGNNRVYRFTPAVARRLAAQLAEMTRREDVGLLVTPSRRSDPATVAILRDALAGLPAVIWDGAGENPYFAFLELADTLIVTGDSVNMVTEAASTGKPVFVVELEGGSTKFRRFHETLRAARITRSFAGRLEHWTYTPLRDTVAVAAAVRRHLAARRQARAAAAVN